MNLKCCFRPMAHSNAASTALLFFRIVAGLAFVFHGWGKIQNPFAWMGPESQIPGFLQLLAAFAEFGGGIAWILGLLTPLASLGMFFTMLVATYFHAVILGDPFVNQTGGGAYELALLYLATSVLLMIIGPGKFSLDNLLFNKK